MIDLLDMSAAVYEALGPDNAWKAFGDGGKDATHHNNYGAYVLAQCVVNGVRAQVPDLAAHCWTACRRSTRPGRPRPTHSSWRPAPPTARRLPVGTDRRSLLGLGALTLAAPGLARAQAPTPSTIEVMDLWPGKPPGGEKVTVTEQVILRKPGGDPNDTAFLNVTKPWLMMRRPAKPNGAAILMIPGGGYIRVAVSKAGGSIDAWIADQGVTAFVMDYRLPADGWAARPDVALQDAQRAIRLIRANAGKWGLDPERIAVTGFSAGGHVAARLATQFGRETYAPVDATDKLSTRPNAAGLFYPVVTMTAPHAHGSSLKSLLGPTRPTPSAWRFRPSMISPPKPRRPSSPPRPTTRWWRWRIA